MRRLAGVPADQWSKAMLHALPALRPPTRQPADASRVRARGNGALETFALHPDLATAFFPFNRHTLWGTTLPPRLRHIVILRVAACRQAAFLWAQHEPQGRDAGLTDEEIARVAAGEAPTSSALEGALVHAVDELIDHGAIAAATWKVLAAELIPQQLLDVVFTAGCYETVAWMMRSVDLETDPAVEEMLAATSGAGNGAA